MIGVEAGGTRRRAGRTRRAIYERRGTVGVLQGTKSYLLQDENGQSRIDTFRFCRARLRIRRARSTLTFTTTNASNMFRSSDDEALDCFPYLCPRPKASSRRSSRRMRSLMLAKIAPELGP